MSRTSGVSRVAAAAGVALGVAIAGGVDAAPITYTLTSSAVSGSINGTAFAAGQTVTVTLLCDTSNLNYYGPPPPSSPFGHYNVASAGSATVQVGAGPVYTFSSAITIWATAPSGVGQGFRVAEGNANLSNDGFSFNPGAGYPGSLTALTTNYASGTQAGFSASPNFQPSAWSLVGGTTFYIDAISASSPVAGSFSSVVGSAVPGAGFAAIGGLGVAGLARRRRRG